MENWSLGLRRRRVLFQLAKNQLNKKEKGKKEKWILKGVAIVGFSNGKINCLP
jgi:hypothetical protein